MNITSHSRRVKKRLQTLKRHTPVASKPSDTKPKTKTVQTPKVPKDTVTLSVQNSEGVFDVVGDLVDKGGDIVSNGVGAASDVVDRGRDVIGSAVDRGRDIAGDATDRASDWLGQAREGADSIFTGAKDLVRNVFRGGYRRRSSRLAEGREEGATVAVIDSFGEADESTTHGEQVESILQDFSGLKDEDIQRYKSGGGGNINNVVNADAEDIPDVLDDYVENRITGLLDGSSDAIEDILSDENSEIRTINQSLGAPEIRIASDLYRELNDDSDFRDRFLESSELPDSASEKQVVQALVDQVAESRMGSQAIKDSEERYDQLTSDANDHGITTVVSAGNYGRFADTVRDLGVETDEEFYRDVLVNEHVISVGATNDQGTTSLDDDTPTAFTSPHADADLSANGQDQSTFVDGRLQSGNGTSFSAPQVAAAAAVLADQYPDLTPDDIKEILVSTAINPGLDESEVGAGILQADAALERAEQLAA